MAVAMARFAAKARTPMHSRVLRRTGIENKGRRRGKANAGEGHALEGASSAKLWFMAVKPPMYSVAIVPLCVGAACARSCAMSFETTRFWMALLGCVLTIAWLNLSNDAFDADTGVDINKPESVVNLLGSKTLVVIIAWTSLLAGIAIFLRISAQAGDPGILLKLLLAILLGYMYQGPPFRLSYKGLGEPICFLTFGPLATSAFYSLQLPGQSISWMAWAASVLVGITTSVILFCSHFHQIVEDRAVNKFSPIVRLGTKRAAVVLQWSVAAFYALHLLFCTVGWLPITCGFTMLPGMVLAKKLVDFVRTKHDLAKEVFVSKYIAVRWHSLQGALLVLGLLWAGRYPS
eukprot:scaffold2636_cov340-Pavlova_lutheri.AAC.134